MSKTSVEDWITEGGFSHSIVTNTYSYTGAALTGREEAYPATPSDPTFYASNCSIENVTIFDAGPIVVIGIGTASISGVYFKNVKNFGGFAAKNARSLLVSNSSFTLGDPILDNVGQVFIDKKEYEDSNLLGVNTVVVNTDTRDSLIEFGAAAAYVKAAIAVYGGGTMTAVGGRVNSLTMFNSSTLVAELFSVMGNVDLTGALSVTWKGGSFYGTKTDPGNLLGTAAAGDYLNI